MEIQITHENGTGMRPMRTIVDSAGRWSIELNQLNDFEDGRITVRHLFNDTAGNSTEVVRHFIKRTSAPEKFDFAQFLPASGIINSATFEQINFSGENLSGGGHIELAFVDQDASISEVIADIREDGSWSFDKSVLTTLKDGAISVSVVRTDALGNQSDPSRFIFTKSLTTPEPVKLAADSLLQHINATASRNLVIKGSAASGDHMVTIRVEDGNGMAKSFVIDSAASGEWSATLDVSDFEDGSLLFSVNQADAFGNESTSITRILMKNTLGTDITTSGPLSFGNGDELGRRTSPNPIPKLARLRRSFPLVGWRNQRNCDGY